MASTNRRKSKPAGAPQTIGAWIPWVAASAVTRLNLSRGSTWRVFFAIAMTYYRYGQQEARLTAKDVATMTKLSVRTVQTAMAELIARGLVVRVGRYRRLRVVLPGTDDVEETVTGTLVTTPAVRHATTPAYRKCKRACTSPTVLCLFSIKDIESSFTANQLSVITDVWAEASESLGHTIDALPISPHLVTDLGLTGTVTYLEAVRHVAESHDRRLARNFVATVLALRHDERVQGRELELDAADGGKIAPEANGGHRPA